MTDYLKRYIHEDGHFKVAVVDTTRVGQNAFQILNPSPIALQLMTRAMAGSLLLAANLKGQGTIHLRFNGQGPLGHLTVEANTEGHVRAVAGNMNLILEKAPDLFQAALGSGELVVQRRTEHHPDVYQSVVSLVNGGMALNLANYLLQSEQVKSGIQIGSSLHAEKGIAGAGGILIQALPEANENLLFIVEDRLSSLAPFGELFARPDGHQQIFEHLFDAMPVKLLDENEVAYRCDCSRARTYQVLASLAKEDLIGLRDEGTPVTLNCSFCNNAYTFSTEDLVAVLAQK